MIGCGRVVTDFAPIKQNFFQFVNTLILKNLGQSPPSQESLSGFFSLSSLSLALSLSLINAHL